MLWITSKSIFTGTKHFHYGTENETFLETDRKQGKLNNCLETCRKRINFNEVRTEFIACCKHHNKNCKCTAGYQGSSNHSCPKHIFTALKLLEVFSEWQWGDNLYQRDSKLVSNRMELSTGAMEEETSPLWMQEIEIRHTKQFALLSWSRNTSGGKTVKFFLGGCWCALPQSDRRSAPHKEGPVLYRWGNQEQGSITCTIRAPITIINTKCTFYTAPPVSCELRRTDLCSAVASLACKKPLTTQAQAVICCHKGINQRELTRTQHVCPGASDSVTGKKKFQLQAQSGWSSLYKTMHELINQNTVFYMHEGAQLVLIKVQQSDFSLLRSVWLISFNIPLVQGFGCIVSFVCNSLFLWQIKTPLICNSPQYWGMRWSVMMKIRYCTNK